MMKNCYLDYAATTPVDPLVLDAMLPYFTENFGNSSSVHRYGQKADAILETCRENVADILRCTPREIIFTSGGTESDNLTLRGAALATREETGADELLISPVEHHAVEKTAQDLERNYGFKLKYLPVDEYGRVKLDELEQSISKKTALVSAIYANNEIGSINPVGDIGRICSHMKVLFHTDAVQAAGVCEMDVNKVQADLISIGAHKMYGPKGVGVLYIKRGSKLRPIQTGGAHEWDMRAGTQNIPLIVGLVKSFQLAVERKEAYIKETSVLRDQIIYRVLRDIPGAILTGHPSDRLPNHASFVFPGVDGNELVILLDQAGYSCSSGSACKTGSPDPSGVLLALGLNPDLAFGSLRVTVGKYTTASEVESFLCILPEKVRQAARNRQAVG
jgi:cysteine desulfurase